MNKIERVEALSKLGAHLENLKGMKLEVVELLSWRPGAGYERHSTVRVEFSFTVKNVMWQMSGGHFALYGAEGECFMLGTAYLASCQYEARSIIVEEHYGDCAERKSIIAISRKQGADTSWD